MNKCFELWTDASRREVESLFSREGYQVTRHFTTNREAGSVVLIEDLTEPFCYETLNIYLKDFSEDPKYIASPRTRISASDEISRRELGIRCSSERLRSQLDLARNNLSERGYNTHLIGWNEEDGGQISDLKTIE